MALFTYALPLLWLVVLALQFRQRHTRTFTFADVALPTSTLVFVAAVDALRLFAKGVPHG